MQQNREASGFSKAPPSDATARQPEIASAAPPANGYADVQRQLGGATVASSHADQPARLETAADLPDALSPQTDGRRAATGSYGALRGMPDGETRPAGRREPPPRLPDYLADLVARYSEELHDPDHVPQNLGQAGRLWEQSGWTEVSFGQALTQAKAITLKSNVKKRARIGGELGTRNKMPFYFTVLRDILGMRKGSQPHADR